MYLSWICGIEFLCVDIICEVAPWNATAIAKWVDSLNNSLERKQGYSISINIIVWDQMLKVQINVVQEILTFRSYLYKR